MNLKPYFNANYKEHSMYKNVPVEFLEETLNLLQKNGVKYRIRYRGSRTNPSDVATRNRANRWQDCLKVYANRFSVYFKE
jgi:hypothetical protein